MLRTLRAGHALAAVIALVPGLASTPASAIPYPAKIVGEAPWRLAPGEWPQSKSDIKADPDTRFGALPNGMRYAVRRQAVPAHQAALRLWFDVGSLQETDQQQGLAHFLEHMAFNGSKGVKENDMVKMLERLGLSFGGDTNASTNYGQTIYTLDLPQTDAQTVDTSLMLLREAAGNLTLDQGAVDRERGIVLSEERARDTPAYRVYKERLAFLLKGQRMPTRHPIGQVEVLKTAPASQLADFYQRFYRPERAVLIVVGDFDAADMEAKIRKLFGDWTAEGPAGVDPDLGQVAPRKSEAKLVVEPGAAPSLQIAWIAPPDLAPDTRAQRRRDIVEMLGFAVLNRRLAVIARSPEPPFISAGASRGDVSNSAEVTTVAVNTEPGRWREGLAAIEKEQRRAAQYGVRQDELEREITEIRAMLKASVAGAATRRPSELAGQILGSLDDQQVVTNPAQNLAFFEDVVKDLTAAEVSAGLKSAFTGSGPLLFMASPTPIEGGEAALLAELAASQKVAVTPPVAQAQLTWPYESFGPPGKVVESRKVEDLGATFIRFANGVRLTVKPTTFRDDEVMVRVNIGDGLLDLPRDRPNPTWASGAFLEGGLKKITKDDMDRVLASKLYGAGFSVGEEAFVLSGGTRTGDLATQLQVLAAYAAEPGWRAEAFQRLKANSRTIHDQLESTDSGVLSRDLAQLLHAGDPRWAFPSREQLAQAKLEDLQGQIAPNLAEGPLEVVIVGDVTVEQATQAVASTFGALPPRPLQSQVGAEARKVAFPKPTAEPIQLTHKGRADQSIGYVAWPTADFWSDPKRARQTAILGEVMRLRLVEQLREAEGATYSPNIGYTHSLVWTGYGYMAASVEVPPEKLQPFFEAVSKIAADLRTNPISADELARAKNPRVEAIQRARVTNQYWLGELSFVQADPRRLDNTRTLIPEIQAVTVADVQRAAQAFLKDEAAFKLVVRPDPKGVETKQAATAPAVAAAAAAR
ncbi:M16 family metallopeptidase [Phenylobacterium deserti]|uniref:Insulinase family protein n=1 Tax=Phenylobacterium deserti TaxID=1914756 RepID=A0A328AN44_9CAUL|nr:insulinase family protein [Phenylobacterium deserti]RAK56413.1 insulinase family protein [Phenylobacterium deserti]